MESVTSLKIHQDLEKARKEFDIEIQNFSKAMETLLNTKDNSFDYFSRLANIGFKSVIGIQETRVKSEQIAKNQTIKNAFDSIYAYYKQHYPQYSIISLKDMITVCEKYGLIFGSVDKYKNLIPEKNLNDVELFFKMMDERIKKASDSSPIHRYDMKNIYQQTATSLLDVEAAFQLQEIGRYSGQMDFRKAHLQITAPKNHFTLSHRDKVIGSCIVSHDDFDLSESIGKNRESQRVAREERRARRLRVTDPIIWVPIQFPMKGGACMIITKWGEEANYPEFANSIEN